MHRLGLVVGVSQSTTTTRFCCDIVAVAILSFYLCHIMMLLLSSRRSLLLLVVLACLSSSAKAAAAARGAFMRDGFNAGMDREFSPENQEIDDSGGMTQEMLMMKNQEWQLDPIDFSQISNKKLKRHLKSLVGKPTRIKVTNLPLKKGLGYRAMGKTANGRKLRAAWRAGTRRNEIKNKDIVHEPYEEAVRRRNGAAHVNIELMLPPVKGSKDLPSLVYDIVVERGSVNPEAIITRNKGKVTLYPKGYKNKTDKVDVGYAQACMPMKAGIVDPSWARGRTIFRKGRSVGQV